jgi:hypothetical protein
VFEFDGLEQLFSLIRNINNKYYEQLSANIIYLEELTNTNYIAYIIELRDAYSHLVKILSYDDISTKGNKDNIQKHLDRYSGHLERLLLDSYRKIINEKYKMLVNILRPKKKIAEVDAKIAEMLKSLRGMNDALPAEKKINEYNNIIKYIDDTCNQHWTCSTTYFTEP